MTDQHKPEDLTEEELAEANREPLPDREQLSVIRGAEPLPFPLVPDVGEWSTDSKAVSVPPPTNPLPSSELPGG